MTLEVVSFEVVPMGPDVGYVAVTSFAIGEGASDEHLLGELLASAGYACEYAGGVAPSDPSPLPNVHGPWYLDRISVDSFQPSDFDAAAGALENWTGAAGNVAEGHSAASRGRLERRVYPLLKRGPVWRLRDLGSDARFEWAVNVGEYIEFVTIDRDHSCLHVVAATDD